MKKLFYFILLAVLVTGLTLMLISLSSVNFDFQSISYIYNPVEVTEEFEYKSKIYIDTTIANVLIEKYDKDNIEIYIKADELNKINITEGVDRITVYQERVTQNFFGFLKRGFVLFSVSYVVKIYLPKDKPYEIFDVKNKTGNIAINDFILDSLLVENTTGNTTISKIESDKMSIKTNTGNIHLIEVKSNDTFVRSTTGNCDITKSDLGEANIKSTTGNIVMIEIDMKKSFIDTTTGDIRADRLTCTELNIEATTGNIRINDFTVTIGLAAKTTTGNITINFFNKNVNDYHGIFGTRTGRVRVYKNGQSVSSQMNGTIYIQCEATTGNIRVEFF